MIRSHLSLARTLLLVLLFALSMNPLPAQSHGDSAKKYVCRPCGLPCDGGVYDTPGTCPKCGMELIDQEVARAAEAAHVRTKVGILIFDGVQIIDYTGPYEVFGAAGFDVYTVAATTQPITTAMGMAVIPKYSFADAPQPDILVVPGGGVNEPQHSPGTLKWIVDVTSRAQHTMSVCNGAFILASAGLLDGLSATTTAGNIERLQSAFPKISVVADRRFTDNGKIITTGGLSSGIDGALHVVATMLGNGMAEQVALLEEYDWTTHAKFARGALADMQIPELGLDKTWKIDRTEGDTDRWEIVVRGTSKLGVSALLGKFDSVLSAKGHWTNVKTTAPHAASQARSDWKFAGSGGAPWKGSVIIRTDPKTSDEVVATVKISRATE